MFWDDRLDERKKAILRAIIDDYINTAEPIGSRTIARKHELGLSSATIRNEMADLEEMGYLAQPHTSAGRIPSDKGYRMYVDHLMKIDELRREEIESIKNAMEIHINELGQLIRQASVVMSRITKYTSMAITPQMKLSALKAVQVVPIETGKALVIVVTDAGIVRNIMVRVPDNAKPEFLIRVSNILNTRLSGLTIEQINVRLIRDLEKEVGIGSEILTPVLNGVAECIHLVDNPEIYLDGTTNILNYPEFMDIVKAREFLNLLDEKEMLRKLLAIGGGQAGAIQVQIGTENELDKIRDCSLITATYSLQDQVLGTIGVIGPTRMEYGRVISSLRYVRKKIDEEIAKLIGEVLDDS